MVYNIIYCSIVRFLYYGFSNIFGINFYGKISKIFYGKISEICLVRDMNSLFIERENSLKNFFENCGIK